MAKATGLGKGLDALLGEEFTAADGAVVSSLPISQIENHAGQPRKHFDEAALEELAEFWESYSRCVEEFLRPVRQRRKEEQP